MTSARGTRSISRGLITWFAALSGLGVVVLFTVALLLPRVLVSQAAQERIRAFLWSRTNGAVVMENVDLAIEWLPRPAVVARRASLRVGDHLIGTIESLAIHPSIPALLGGRLAVTRVEALNPTLSVNLPEPADQVLDLEAIEGQIRAWLTSLATHAPGLIVRVEGGAGEVRIGQGPPLVITGLEGQLAGPPDEMDLRFRCRANAFDSLRVEGTIASGTLAGQARISIERLHLREALESFLPRLAGPVESGDVSGEVALTAVGLRTITAEVDGVLPSLGLGRGAGRTVIEGGSLKAVARLDRGVMHAVVERLAVVAPRVTATGELTVDETSSGVTVTAAARDVDIAGVRTAALAMAPTSGAIASVFHYLKGGHAPEINIQGTGQSLADLWQNFGVTGTLRGGTVLVPGANIDLDDVSGSLVIARGVLEAKEISARFGRTQGSHGMLRLGLEGGSAPFHLEMMFRADAAELRESLLRMVEHDGVRRALAGIRHIAGEISGRLVVGERIDSLAPSVFISQAAVTGSHAEIPYPISIAEGSFRYGDGRIGLEGVGGAVGRSSFSGITATVSYAGSPEVEISSGTLSLDVAQAKRLADRCGGLPAGLRAIEALGGRLEVGTLSLRGPLDGPNGWAFSSSGSFDAVALDHANLPGVMSVSGGTFQATQSRVTVSRAEVDLLDASLTIDGSLESLGPAGLSLETTASGSIGAQMMGWLSRAVELPEALRQSLAGFRHIAGSLSGRLDLDAPIARGPGHAEEVVRERSASLSPRILISKAAMTGSHDEVPYPISITEGRFRYGDGRVGLEGVGGAVGRSSFSGINAALSYAGSPEVEISSGTLSLDVAQAKSLANRFAGLPPGLREVEALEGRLEVETLSLRGPLEGPNDWTLSSSGAFEAVAVQHPNLPGVMKVSGGTFQATQAAVAVSRAEIDLLDASLTIDGSVEDRGPAGLGLEATAAGSIGAQMTEWLSRAVALPEALALRPPVQVTASRLRWSADGEAAVRGDFTVGGGPRLSVDLVRGRQAMEVKQIVITDGGQSARLTLDLGPEHAAGSFSGAVDRKMLSGIFRVPPLEAGLIQGDVQVSTAAEAPWGVRAQGRLAGREVRVPLGHEHVLVEDFSLDVDDHRVDVRSAHARWRNSHLSFMGTVLAEPKALRIDMDVAADRGVWEEIAEAVARESRSGEDDGRPGIRWPAVEGTARLTVDHFTVAGFSWRPVQATASLTSRGLRADIQRSEVCGIGVAGSVDVADGAVGLDLSMAATDGQLEPTSLCVTENRYAISGRYSLRARLAARGTPADVLRTLSGDFEFSARDGQFVQSLSVDGVLEATFDYLNSTRDFEVTFPDLGHESFAFRSMSSRGRVEGLTLVKDEVTIQSSRFTIGGHGRVDFENGAVDARGLVSVRVPGDRLIRRIPVIGSLLGGSIVGIPVRVTGSLERPDVTYLSPADVGAELLNIPTRALGVPRDAIRLFTPDRRAPAWE